MTTIRVLPSYGSQNELFNLLNVEESHGAHDPNEESIHVMEDTTR